VCFLEGDLDEPRPPAHAIGARFGKTHKGAVRIIPSLLASLDPNTRRILDDRRYVMTGTFWLPADRFDKKFVRRGGEFPYRGVHASDGALYVRGSSGTQDFRDSMSNLGRLGTDRAAQDYLRKRVRDLARSVLDEPESSAMDVVVETAGPMPIDSQLIILSAMSEYILADGPGTIPGGADIVRAAHLTGKIQKLVEADAKARGIPPVRHGSIDQILDAVWNNVDLGLYVHTGRPEFTRGEDAFGQIESVPDDLVGKCRKFTVAGDVGRAIGMLRRMPNLTHVHVATNEYTAPTFEQALAMQAIMERMHHLDALTVDKHGISGDIPDWTADSRLRVSRLTTWIPRSAQSIPGSVRDLEILCTDTSWDTLASLAATGSVPGVEKLTIRIASFPYVGAREAGILAEMFPNVRDLEIVAIPRSEIDGAAFFAETVRLNPRLVRLVADRPESGIGIVWGLSSHPNLGLAELRLGKPLHGTIADQDIAGLDRVGRVLDSVPNVKKIGLDEIGEYALHRRYAARRFDVIDLSWSRRVGSDFAIPPVRVLRATGFTLSELSILANLESPPKAIMCDRNDSFTRRDDLLGLDPRFLMDVVSLSIGGYNRTPNIAEWLRSLLGSTPKLQYLTFGIPYDDDPTGIVSRAPKIEFPALTTLHVIASSSMFKWVISHVVSMLEPPANLVITTGSNVDITPSELKTICAELSGVRTICFPYVKFVDAAQRPGNTAFYPTNVFTGEKMQLAIAKSKELTWYEDPWNPNFDAI
jgi:hypothetical protein